jgi:oligosaccharide repeat unit polymerase
VKGSAVFLLVIATFIYMEATISEVSSNPHDSISESIAPYFGGPLKSYETILLNQSPFTEDQFYSFDMINYVLKKIGFIDTYPDLVREYVFIPFPTNMYSFLDAFTLDFGILGALLFTYYLGFLLSVVFNYAHNGCCFAIIIFSFIMYDLIMVPCNNEFIRFSFFLNIILAGLIHLFITSNSGTVQILRNKK